MAWGLPGVSFDLESLKTYYPYGMIKTKCYNLQEFADNILLLIENKKLYNKISKKEAYILITQVWDWNKRADLIYQKIFNNENQKTTENYDYDIVLISPPSRMINHYRPPLALMYVGGYLQHKGLRVKIIDVPMKQIIRDENFYKNIDSELKKIEKQMIKEFSKLKTKTVG